MRAEPECIPCIYKLALSMAQKSGADNAGQLELLKKVAADVFPEFTLDVSPPENSLFISDYIRSKTGVSDLFLEEKGQSNREALALYPKLKQLVEGAEDRLLEAAILAIGGNIIDFGVLHDLDITVEIQKIIDRTGYHPGGHQTSSRLFDFDSFASEIANAQTILYLGDNAGEIVFDKLLVETIKSLNPGVRIVYAVRDEPIMNDVLLQDAEDVGMGNVAEVMSSGSRLPGTIPEKTSVEFQELFHSADMVISKGQGNIETLTEHTDRDVFFLLMAKCPVISRYLGCKQYDIILTRRR